jgi:hypothetical protein
MDKRRIQLAKELQECGGRSHGNWEFWFGTRLEFDIIRHDMIDYAMGIMSGECCPVWSIATDATRATFKTLISEHMCPTDIQYAEAAIIAFKLSR